MATDKVNELMAIVDGFTRSIKEYDGHFNMKSDCEQGCVMAGYRDSGYGILFSLFTQSLITSGEFHRKLHGLNTELYKKID